MPRYGFCSQCNQSVWLNEYGACPNGHGPEFISGAAEAGGPPAPPYAVYAPQTQKRSKVWLLVLAVIVVPALLFGCVLFAIAIPVFNTAADTARTEACYASERMMEGGYEVLVAEAYPNQPVQITDYRSLEDALLAEGIIYEPAVCPAGGTYEFVNGDVNCSVHGHY